MRGISRRVRQKMRKSEKGRGKKQEKRKIETKSYRRKPERKIKRITDITQKGQNQTKGKKRTGMKKRGDKKRGQSRKDVLRANRDKTI